MAFEEQGFCVVRGPDLLWGGDIRRFHPPAGKLDGIIGGPPCQAHSSLVHLVRHCGYQIAEDLIPEFVRCVSEARPRWFLMENVPAAPVPTIEGYAIHSFILNNRWVGGEQERKRRFSFGRRGAQGLDLRAYLQVEPLEAPDWGPAVCARGFLKKRKTQDGRWVVSGTGQTARLVARSLELQGLPADFFAHSPLTVAGQQRMIGNGVPLPMGRAVAAAVREALEEAS